VNVGAEANRLAVGISRRLRLAARAAMSGERPAQRTDMGPDFWALQQRVAPHTQTTPERLFALREALRYVARARVPGDVVECGVWQGGSSMMAALTMLEVGDPRHLWLYDTYEGMPAPGEHDRDYTGVDSGDELARQTAREGGWNVARLDDVRMHLASTGYRDESITYVEGMVEETIPAQAPSEIALLRLDTDFYESTRHELRELWPRVSPGGVLIVDDYGHFHGARKAVDEYFAGEPVLLARIDYTGRIAVKR
jgi:hypothetical protein